MPAVLEYHGGTVMGAVRNGAMERLRKAVIFYRTKVVEAVSVPAPRRIVRSKDGTTYYRATTKAIDMAPPRLVSGTLRKGIEVEYSADGMSAKVISKTPAVGRNRRPYSLIHEQGRHPFLVPTLQANKKSIEDIFKNG